LDDRKLGGIRLHAKLVAVIKSYSFCVFVYRSIVTTSLGKDLIGRAVG